MSGFKPEYLEGIYNKIEDLEKTQRLISMLSILNISVIWGSDEATALDVLNVFSSIFFDKGEYDVDDLKREVEKMKLALPKDISEATKRLMIALLDQLIPSK